MTKNRTPSKTSEAERGKAASPLLFWFYMGPQKTSFFAEPPFCGGLINWLVVSTETIAALGGSKMGNCLETLNFGDLHILGSMSLCRGVHLQSNIGTSCTPALPTAPRVDSEPLLSASETESENPTLRPERSRSTVPCCFLKHALP